MNCWPLKSIGEVCEVNPRLPRGHGIPDDQIVSFVPMAAVDEVSGTIMDDQVRPFSQVKKGYTHFWIDDVLFAKITPCMENGKAAIVSNLTGGLGFGSTEFHVLRSKGEVLPAWLFYFLRQPTFRSKAKRNFTGTAGQQRVPTTFLASTFIPVPPLDEQRRIVDLLSLAEGIVRLRREAKKKAAELIPALFFDLFGNPATNPKGYAVVALGEVVEDFRYGTSQKSGPTGLPVLRIPNVVGDRLEPLGMKFVEVQKTEADHLRLLDGDFLFVRTNGNPDYVGRSAVFDSEVMRQAGYNGANTIYASYLIRARIQRSRLDPYFLQGYLSSTEGRRKLKERCRTSAGQFNINTNGLASIPVPLPPLAMQLKFLQHYRDVFGIQSQQSAATAKAQAAFDALLARSFAQPAAK